MICLQSLESAGNTIRIGESIALASYYMLIQLGKFSVSVRGMFFKV